MTHWNEIQKKGGEKMDSRERDAILWQVLEPTVINLGTQKPLNDGLSKAFRHLTPEERDAVEAALSEHEMALAIACYNVGIAQGVGIAEAYQDALLDKAYPSKAT